MDVENKCQQEARQVLEELESIAFDLKMKTRILDSIREMRSELEEPFSETEWKKKIAEADELIDYVKRQAGFTEKTTASDDGACVTEQEAVEKILEILNTCYEVNELQNEGYEKGYRNCARKAEQEMREMTNVEANFRETLSAHMFREHFNRAGQRYEQQMNQEAEQYVEELTCGYQAAMKKIRKLLSTAEIVGITKMELYKQWDEKLDFVERKMKHEAAETEKGGGTICEFGEKSVDAVQKIVTRNEKRRGRMKKMPLYVMLASLAGFLFSVIMLVRSIAGILSDQQIDAESAGEMLDLVEKGANVFGKIGETGAGAAAASASAGGFAAALPVIFMLLLIGAIFWYLLIKVADRKYKERVCKEVSNYMIKQVDCFWKEKQLENQMKESERRIRRIVDEKYKSMFAEVFQKTFSDGRADADEKSRLLKVCGEWERIRRSV